MHKRRLTLYVFFLLALMTGSFLGGCNGEGEDHTGSGTGTDTTVKTPPKEVFIMAKVRSNGLYGYIDTLGNYIIPPQYPLAKSFSQNMAGVNIGGIRQQGVSGVEGGIYEFIDPQGKQITHLTASNAEGFIDGTARFSDSNNLWGWINTDGEVVGSGFDMLNPFSDGVARAGKLAENKFGYVDKEGNWILNVEQQDQVGDFCDGLAYKVENGKYGYINKQGEFVIPPRYDFAGNFSEGLASVSKDGKFGFVDITGKEVIALQYPMVGSFYNGYAGVSRDNKWSYIDKNGSVITDFQFDNVRAFSQGVAAVLVNGKVGYFKLDGSWLVQPRYEDGSDFNNGFAPVKENGKIGYINLKGQMVLPAVYEVGGAFVDIREETDIRYF